MATKEFEEALMGLPKFMQESLREVPLSIQNSAREIRLRAGRKVAISLGNRDYFLHITLGKEEMFESFRALCGYSVHSHTEEIKQGYITLPGGHRAGLCGTAVYEGENISNLRDISSINIRIARQIKGVSNDLFKRLNGEAHGLLLAGAPASGKTTLLKDIILNLSDKKVSVIDSRGELGACLEGVPQNDLGNADIFDGWQKSDGMLAAIRTMAPDILVCDEIGGKRDLEAVESCMNAGVSLIASVHAGSLQELKRKPYLIKMLHLGAFSNIALLKGKHAPCEIDMVIKAGDLSAYFRDAFPSELSDHFGVRLH